MLMKVHRTYSACNSRIRYANGNIGRAYFRHVTPLKLNILTHVIGNVPNYPNLAAQANAHPDVGIPPTNLTTNQGCGAGAGAGAGTGGGGDGYFGPHGDDHKPNEGPPPSKYPVWLRVWILACGAVYWLFLRPRLFEEREERRRHFEREAAEFQRYEDDWDTLVAKYASSAGDEAKQAKERRPWRSRRGRVNGGGSGNGSGSGGAGRGNNSG
ncbi:hypothetical protein Vretifemale_3750 [Volvox reticuliferus]|nr:hypothetical protein Vretifemale_3750 [Volvox reticuliferus]